VPQSAQAIAELVGGRLVGDGSRQLSAVGSLEGADGETLSLLAAARYLPALQASRAGAVLLAPAHQDAPGGVPARIVVADPHAALARVLEVMFPAREPGPAIHASAQLGPGVLLGRGVRLGPGVVLERGVEVGDGSTLGPNVVCREGTRIGRRCVIQAGAVLGGAGFGFTAAGTGDREPGTGLPVRIPHVGSCIIEDDVEIGANCTVDRGSIDDTVIGPGCKLDNLVHVGHNARLGARCLVMGGSVIAGSANIGDDVIIAGHAAVGGHFRVGRGARIGAKAGVISAVPDGAEFSGFPARPHREHLRAQAALYRLARITDELEALVQARKPDA
jgi:UDP-3-O-[3-hydroxymyristoyl] glucosamine N-acyltransferase